MTAIIELANATVRGIEHPDGSCEFLGLRYATAGRGEYPADHQQHGDVDATSYGPICCQVPGFLEQTLGLDSASMSEDCFSVNVFVPPNATPDSQLPVLFWIHGGAYTNGAGSLAWYHGGRLASRQTIVVTINYRLGIFGFLGKKNLGVHDMVSALRWTQRNIASFGGNPNNVTIFGESAGGSAVISLMACAEARSLFHKAWSMSPSIGQLRSRERALEIEAEVVGRLGVSSGDDLRQHTVENLLQIQTEVLALPSQNFDWFAPTADGEYIQSSLLQSSAEHEIPFVIGTNRDENKLWAAFDPQGSSRSQDDWTKFVSREFPSDAAFAQSIYEKLRHGESPHYLMSAVNTDIAFRFRAWDLVDNRLTHGTPTWMYWFTWSTPAFGGILGSCHALDIPFAFDNLHAPGGDMFTGTGSERQAIADRFADEIVQFAQHGHPSWAQYDSGNRYTLVIDATVELVSDPEAEIRALRPI